MQKECSKRFFSKKAQLTIFVIIAVVIVAAIAGYVIYRNQTAIKISSEFISAKQNIDACLSDALMSSIYSNGLEGGYFNVPEPKLSYLSSDIPIYYSAKTNTAYVPSEQELERQLALTVNDSSYLCLDTFNEIRNESYGLTVGAMSSVKTMIKNQTVEADINWPIVLSKGDKTQEISQFTETVNFDLNGKYEDVKDFIEQQKASPQEIPVENLLKLGASRGFEIETINEENLTSIYTFIYKNQTYNNAKFIYAFGVEYG